MDAIKQIFLNDASHNRTKLNDMYPEIMLMVFNELSFPDLLAMAQMNHKFSILANDVVRRKFSTIVVNEPYLESHSLGKEVLKFIGIRVGLLSNDTMRPSRLSVPQSEITLFDNQMILKTMKYLGSGLRKVTIYYNKVTYGNEIEVIGKYINEYCHDTLEELQLSGSDETSLNYMKNPFKRIERVSLLFGLPEYDEDTLPMNELFPALRNLTLVLGYDENDYIACNFPHLEHVYLHLTYAFYRTSSITDMITANPQIRTINVRGSSTEFLQFLSESLPNLQVLTLGSSQKNNHAIHFASVEKFVVNNLKGSPINVTFSQLNELEIICDADNIEDWNEFIRRHPNVTVFRMRYLEITDEQFERLAMRLSNVQQMSVDHAKGNFIGAQAIIRFIESHKQLRKFDLHFRTEAATELFKTNFSNEWIVTNNGTAVSFARNH